MLNPLKKRFPSLQSLGGDGNTSFLRAARAGNLDRVLEHLKNNIDINTSNANGLNALHLASKDGHVHVVSELLRRGAIVDSATKKGNTALHIASLAGQEEVVKLLLQHSASVNVQSQNGFTPLYMAAQENHDSVVKLLLANGANQSLATEDGFTPLAVAMQQGHDKVVAVLLESDTRGKVRLPALHIAAKKDDVKAATLLLDNDHNPDVTSKSGFTPLHIASHYGNQSIANLLIQKGADVNFSAKHNISPLHVAAKWGKTNMVSLLLEKGANIEAKTRDGLTPLHCAARSGHEQVVDMLLERGAPISAKTKNGLAPLHMAAQGEHVDAARILLYHRAPVDEVTVDYLTALHVAAHCGHVRVAKLLLDRNADANARALNGFTPLHIACKKNRIKVVELLLRHGASISATTESGLTPLHVAAFMGCMNIVIYLLQHDASPDVPTVRGETPLHLAARANQTDIIRILLRNGAQVDARAREQQTPLHIASRLGNVDIVMLLLQHGAQVDATTKDMYTALHIAAKEGQDEVAAVLIDNGASLDAATKKGFSPLHLTAKYGHIKVAQLLLQKEADVDAQGKNGVTPLHVACHYDNQNVALLLLEKGGSPHAIAKNGHTPLHIAARKNQMDIATTLLEFGAHANAESKAGFTPLHLSSQEGHSELSNLLIEHKANVNHPAKNGLTPMHLCAQEDNVNVAEILERNGANIDMATKAGYTPLHVASHFGQANMVRFLLQHGANVNVSTSIGYTPLHQTAQQGHCHIVNLLLEHKANANAKTANGQTPLHIARKLGYISVLDSLKSITNEDETSTTNQMHAEEKYRVVAPEAMHESFMSDSEEEGGEDNMLSDQPYRYLTVDEMKSLGDDSLPIDVTRDERVDSNRVAQSSEYAPGLGTQSQAMEGTISPHKTQVYATTKSAVDGIYVTNGIHDEQPHVGRKLSWKSFLVSFLVDARGGAMRGCRHSGVRVIIPSRSTCQPTRVTCRYVKPQRTMHPPQLMEGEALASRVLELGPVSTKFIGPVIMEVPHFASLRGKEREIIILRSDNGETWREHNIENSDEIIHDVLQQCFESEEIAQMEEQSGNHVCRFVTYDFPQYFAVVSRIRQEVHAIGPEGGMVSSTVVPQVQAVFPQGALTKKIKVGLQAQPVDPDLTAKLLGRGVAVSPIVTVEPRRRKFHKAITLSMPAPKAHSQGMINQYSGNTPTLRLLCSITGGPSRAQWEDVTGSTPLTFVNDCVSFTTTVSARFWLMDCRNISEATKMATELYKEVIHVPFIAKFVVFAKKVEPYEARLRVFCMTDDREDKTLEKLELFTQVAKSRDVEVLESKPQYIEMAGNLVPVTKSGEQLQLPFKAFRENRLPFTVRVKDQHADIVGRTLFMKEPKVAKGEPPQHPICILNIVLPETVIPDSTTAFSDKITSTYRSSLLSFSKHQNDHYIGDIRIVDLSNLLGKDWIRLATEIGISTEEIDEIINQNTDSIARQAQSMIRLYKDKPNYDIGLLEVALKNIGRDDIMSKCKSGRLSHSRDFDDTDIMKNSESVEELVRLENKRIQQINESEEVKYSAEEKEIEDSESDEEVAKQTVAERREKIVKRLSVERQIPASSQKKEITREITEIKRKSLIEDKKAMHESEIFMQLPADNSVKSTVVSEHVIKMKLGKKDSSEVSKSDFDKELTYKFKTSSRSSEETDDSSLIDQKSHQDIDNLKITKDLSSVEKTSKISDFISMEMESSAPTTEVKKLSEDFLSSERLTEQEAQPIIITEKFTEEFKEKMDLKPKVNEELKETAEQMVKTTMEKASKKVESIISVFEAPQTERIITKEIIIQTIPKEKEIIDEIQSDEQLITWDIKDDVQGKVDSVVDEKVSSKVESASVKDKIKTFTEQKLDDPLKETFVTGTKKVSETVKVFSSPKVDDVKQTAADILHKQFTEIEEKMDDVKTKEKIIDAKSTIITGLTDSKTKDSLSESEESIIVLPKSVKDTAKTFAVSDLKSKLTDTKVSFLEDKVYDPEKHYIEDVKDHVVIDAVKDTFKSTEKDFSKKTAEIKEKVDDTIIDETKSVKDTIQIFTKDKIGDLKDKADKFDNDLRKVITFATEKVDDLKSEEVGIKEKLTETRESIKMETESVADTIKDSIEYLKSEDLKDEIKEILVDTTGAKDTIESKAEDVKTKVSKIEDRVKDTKVSFTEHFLRTERMSDDTDSKPTATTITSVVSVLEPTFSQDKKSLIEDKVQSLDTVLQQMPTESVKIDEKKMLGIEERTSATAIEDVSFRESIEKLEEMKSIVTDARKITQDFLGTEQHSRIPVPTKLKKEVKTIETTKKETFSFPPTVEKDVILTEKLTKTSEQTKIPIKEITKITTDQSKDKFKMMADHDEKASSVGESIRTKTIETVTFKTIHEPIKKPIESMTTVAAKEVTVAAPVQLEEKTKTTIKDSKLIDKDSELTATVKDATKDDILTKEHIVELLQADELVAPAPFEPRKSLTDAEFCKSVQETITKKMSEGLIEISDELQLKVGSDIPPSQTPPPTPIDTKSEKQEREEIIVEKTLLDGEQLADTVKTLHKTTESTFERISTTTRIETLDEYLPESHSKTTKQDDKDDKILDRKDNTKYADGEKHEKEMDDEDDDDDDEDDEEDYERDKSVIDAEISVMKLASDKDENVRFQAKILVDRVLEDSIHVVDEQRDQDDVDNNKHDYNSESENYAITCDDINGLEVIKSPTIESMSGKSFDDNMSFTDEHLTVATTTNTTHVSITTTVTTATSAISSLPQQPADSEVITGVNKITEKEIGGDLIKSTVITPVPPSATISSSSTDIIGSSIQDTPTPKPRLMKRTSPSAEDIKKFVEIETADGGSIPKCISEIPVPKPRSQMKPTESYKNLAALQVDSDSPTDISLTKRNATETVMEGTTSSDDSVKKSEIFESSGSKTSFYIGESSQNIIIKTTSPKSLLDLDDNAKSVLNEIPQKNAEDINKEKKDSIEFKSADPDYMSKITRQSSETRNDLLEQDVIVSSDKKFEPTEFDLTIKDAKDEDENEKKEKIVLEKIAPQNVTQSQLENGLNKEIFEPKGVELEKRCELELPLEKDDWEINAKEIPPPSKNKIVYSPQQPTEKIVKPPFTEEIVTQTLDEVQESIEAAKRGLKSVLKDAKLIKESPSEFEFRTLAQSLTTTKQPHLEDGNLSLIESEDISSFIGIPEPVSNVVDNLNKKAVAAHYTEAITDEKKLESGDEYASLGFVSTGTYDSDPQISREDYASLGFVSTETVEDFSSMEDYYQENIAKAHETIEPEEKKETIEIDSAMIESADDEKPVISIDAVIHRTKSDESETGVNRWSVPEIDHSSSSESYYRSLEKSPSRPLSSDVDNLMTQANSSDYQTAIDASGTYRESTEFASAVSRFDSSSEKTISSHESMRSLDSHSETSAYLGSIDVSELSETLVASSMEEADEIARLQDLADEEDSEESLDLEMSDYAAREGNVQQSMMKRSQEMIFKLKADDGAAEEIVPFKGTIETVQIEEYPKTKEVEKSWDFVYPKEEQRLEEGKDSEDMIVSKFASSLDEGSVLSVSMSSASNIDTVVENFEDMIGSVGASSVASIEGFMFPSDEHASSSLPEDTTFVIELDNVNDQSPQDTTNVTPPDELRTKRGHKRGESASINDDLLKNVGDKEILPSEGKESESESDTDPYETEYSRQFRSPIDRKSKKKKHTGVDVELSFVETEKRPFTPSQLIAEVIVEDAVTEELEAEECFSETRRPSQNMQDYSNIPDITVTQDTPKLPDLDNFSSKFQEKSLYKVKTQEELHRASDDRPLYNEKSTDSEEENFKKMVQQQYQKKLAELQKAQIGDSDYDDHKTPDSPDSFEMVDKPDISDEFVIIEEVAKEANEDEMGGKSIRIKPAKYEYQHDEEVEKIIIKSAPADPKLGSQILRDDLNFEFEESPPTASSGGAGSEPQEDADPSADAALGSRRWVEMQLVDNQLRYPYELTGGVLEDIKEEDAEFEVGSSRISSFKDSFSSTPDYDVLAARRHYSRGDHDDISMSSLQEFESLEQAISLENRNRTHQGSTDSSNGSFTRRYMVRHGNASGVAHGDDISISSLKEFEGLENACIEAHLIEIKAKEEAALLSRSDESNKSNGSDRDPTEVNNVAIAKAIGNLTQSGAINDSKLDIGILLKQKLEECEKRAADYVQSTEATSERREIKPDSTSIKQHSTEEREHSVNISPTTVAAATDSDITSSRIVSTTTTTTILGSSNLPLAAETLSRDQMTKDTSMDSLNLSAVDQTTSSAGTTATYQTSAGNSQMSGSVTSCASSTLMEESAITTTSSWSSEEKTVIERLDNTTDIQQAKH